MATRVLAVIQARLGSTRLPGKTLADIAGRPMLAHVVERAKAIRGVDEVVLAIADRPDDDRLADFARASGLRWARGSETDVLDRTYKTLCECSADAIVRISPDCPLLDPKVSGLVVAEYRRLEGRVDYVSNVAPPTYPDGLDTEVMCREALERAWREARRPSDREHVTTYIRREFNPSRLHNVNHSPDHSGMRWTVDTAADLEFVRTVHKHLNPDGRRLFGMEEILGLLRRRPDIAALNVGPRRNEGLERSLAADSADRGLAR